MRNIIACEAIIFLAVFSEFIYEIEFFRLELIGNKYLFIPFLKFTHRNPSFPIRTAEIMPYLKKCL